MFLGLDFTTFFAAVLLLFTDVLQQFLTGLGGLFGGG